ELNHPFSHHVSPRHTENLAAYWAEVLGGPPCYSQGLGGHSEMLTIHAGEGAPEDMGTRFAACFIQAMDDAQLPADLEFRHAMRADFLAAIDAASRMHFTDGTLSRAQHEMIASYVSALNRCRY